VKWSRETCGALFFLAGMGICFAVLIVSFFQGGELREAFGAARREGGFAAFSETAEAAANSDLDETHFFIQLFGGYQRLLGRRIIEDAQSQTATVVKLADGALTFANLSQERMDVTANAEAAAQLKETLAGAGIPYLFTVAPQKLMDNSQLPAGIQNYSIEEADLFLDLLADAGVDTLDLRPWFESHGNYGDWFFRTDHHWRPEAAFAAWGVLAGEMTQRYGFSFDPALTDESHYEKTVYERFFLGSQGKRVGTLYGGVDDFTVYTPKFDTDLTYTCPFYGIDRTGPFNQSVCFPERIAARDWFDGNPYTYYAGGDYPLARAVNRNNPEGPKILLIRDSFACAMTPFLALGCSELVTVDLRYFSGDLTETILSEKPDLVVTLYTVGTLSNPEMFCRTK